VKKVAEKWEIWDEKEEIAKSEEEAKKLVSQRFYKWIHVFEKKTSEKMLMNKVWNYAKEIKKGFVLRKEKVYPLFREERGDVYKIIQEKLRKWYIRPLKLSQMALFFVGKKNSKNRLV